MTEQPTSQSAKADGAGNSPPSFTLADFLEARAASTRPCLLQDGLSISWSDLATCSRAFAGGLAEIGVKPGDRVAIWLPNGMAWLVAFFACGQLGATAVAINTRFRSAEVGDLLRRSGSKVLIYWPGFKHIDFDGILDQCPTAMLGELEHVVLYSEGKSRLPTAVAGKPAKAYADMVMRAPLRETFGTAESPCLIVTTSGTTKAPKLVQHSQRNVLRHACNVTRQYRLGADSRLMLCPPLCGVFGFNGAMAALTARSSLILAPRWDAGVTAGLIERYGATHMIASDDAVGQLLDIRPAERIFPTLQLIGAAHFNPAMADIVARGEQRGLTIVGLYGSSELQALFSLGDRDAAASIRGRAGGRPASAVAKVRVRDPHTRRICEAGEAGELEFFAPDSRFIGYFGDGEATEQAFTSDGYFKSGDLGSVEPDGSFVFLARMGDTLRLSGFLVAPAEIEALIQQHPAVASCQVVGVEQGGAMRPIAFAIARPDVEVIEQDVIGFAAARLARYKVPARLLVIEAFPTTSGANGTKVQKSKLREMAVQRLSDDSK